jgi:asparagine synthase (glutamine-hydrolysing)
MCGVCGVVALDGHRIPQLNERLEVMSDLIAHRGPDGNGRWASDDGRAGLAHRRLSIIDVTDGGHQPMSTPHTSISYNGEIYNYLELREEIGANQFQSRSDTETILLGYERWGEDVVSHLRGMFAFALWDERKKSLFLARDRFGIKPLYYYLSPENRVYFASEAKALLPFLPSLEVDQEGIRDYLIFQQPLEYRTLFRHIHQLPPAHTLTVAGGHIKVKKYWEVFYERDFSHNDAYFIDRAAELLADSVDVHMRADVPIGAYVSGGIDSGIVATMAAEENELLCFTGFVDEGAAFDERKHAYAITDHAGSTLLETEIRAEDIPAHLTDIIYHLDYPVAGPGAIPQYVVSQFAAQHRKVVLGGQGGDELFGGYVRYLIAYFEQCIKGGINGTLDSADFIVTYESIIPNLGVLKPYEPLLKEFFSDGLFDSMDERYLKLVQRASQLGPELNIDLHNPYDPRETFLGIFNAQNVENGSFFDSMTHVDFKTLLPALLQVEDRVSMAHGLESRVPMLDHPLVEFAATIPADVKFKDGNLKRVLKRVGDGVLPESVLARNDKMGFPLPLARWLKESCNEWTRDVFNTGAAIGRDYVDAKAIPQLLDTESTFGRTMWGYLSLELWHQQFIDQASRYRSLDPGSPVTVQPSIAPH